MLVAVSRNDDFFNNCLERMRSTMSIQYRGDVNLFNDYKIAQVSICETFIINMFIYLSKTSLDQVFYKKLMTKSDHDYDFLTQFEKSELKVLFYIIYFCLFLSRVCVCVSTNSEHNFVHSQLHFNFVSLF